MKATTIWESASRPLFVRSVWLQSTNFGRGNGRGHHRHFILDYEIDKMERYNKLLQSPLKNKRSNCKSIELSEYSELEQSVEDSLQLDSGKMVLHTQSEQQQQQRSKNKCQRTHKCQAYGRKKQISYEYFRNSRFFERNEHLSRRSSLQDVQSNLSNMNSSPDERLAERVLNWLDLAGRTDLLKSTDPTESQGPDLDKACPQKNEETNCTQAAMKKSAKLVRINPMNRKLASQPRKNAIKRTPTAPLAHSILNAPACKHGSFDSVKHITIIFNKDGIPVRFNRPVRNIDLCALSSSPSKTRRLAGPLASARLYKHSENNRQAKMMVNVVTAPTANMDGCHNANSFDENVKKLSDDKVSSSYNDAKKQLHIFMPSLPKKGILVSQLTEDTTIPPDDDINHLSNNFNELCRM